MKSHPSIISVASPTASTSSSNHSTPPAPTATASLSSTTSLNSPNLTSTLSNTGTASTTTASTNQLLDFLSRAEQGLRTLTGAGNFDARPSRQSVPLPKVGSCTACREAKARCSGGEVCTRCAVNKIPRCEYPVFMKRGRKRAMTPNMILLENITRDVEMAKALITRLNLSNSDLGSPMNMNQGSLKTTRDSRSRSPPAKRVAYHATVSSTANVPNGEQDDSTVDDPLASVIESPLAVLAHISSMKISGTTEAETGTSSATLQKAKDETPPDSYFSTGLYQARTDREPLLDPVNLGLLTEADFARLVQFYFDHLHQFSWHLSPDIHTPRFIRDVSPFLATALANAVAPFDPTFRHLSSALETHALYLSERVFSEGFKTLEIVQAYCLLIYWAPLEPNWGDDRRWSWMGQAIRIAAEIRLDKPLTPSMHQFYRLRESMRESGSFQTAIASSSSPSHSLCVSTGRTGAIQGLSWTGGFKTQVPSAEPDSPHYQLLAMEDLNRIYSKALALSASLKEESSNQEEGLREAFNGKWQREMTEWEQKWSQANIYVRLTAQHNRTILWSISLRHKGGPSRQIFDECRASATKTLRLAVEHPGDNLEYMTNYLVVNIAYAATLALRIDSATATKSEQALELRHLCHLTADLMARNRQKRPSTRSAAALHATRIPLILAASEPSISNIPNPMLQNRKSEALVLPTVSHADPTQIAFTFFQNQQSSSTHPPQDHLHQFQPMGSEAIALLSDPSLDLGFSTPPTLAEELATGLPNAAPTMWDIFHPYQFGLSGEDWMQTDRDNRAPWGASEPGTWAW